MISRWRRDGSGGVRCARCRKFPRTRLYGRAHVSGGASKQVPALVRRDGSAHRGLVGPVHAAVLETLQPRSRIRRRRDVSCTSSNACCVIRGASSFHRSIVFAEPGMDGRKTPTRIACPRARISSRISRPFFVPVIPRRASRMARVGTGRAVRLGCLDHPDALRELAVQVASANTNRK